MVPVRSIPFIALLAASVVGGWMFGAKLRSAAPEADGGVVPTERKSLTPVAMPAFTAPGTPVGKWMERVKKAEPVDFLKLMEEWEMIFPETEDGLRGRRGRSLSWFFGIWLTKDVDDFLKASIGLEFEYYSTLAGEALARVMPDKAVEVMSDREFEKWNKDFVEGILEGLANHAPATYLKLDPDGTLRARLDLGRGDENWQTAVVALAGIDPVAAGNACLGWNSENIEITFIQALRQVAKVWKPGNPTFADWVEAISDPGLRNLARHARISTLAESDPLAALMELRATSLEPNNSFDCDAPKVVLARLADVDSVGALQLMKDQEIIFAKHLSDLREDPSAYEKAGDFAFPFTHLAPNWTLNVEDNGVRDAVLGSLVKCFPDEPELFFAVVGKLVSQVKGSDPDWQRQVVGQLLRSKSRDWSAEQCLAAVRQWGTGLSVEKDTEIWDELAFRAASANVETVCTALDQLPEAARPVFAASAVRHLAGYPPERTIELLGRIAPGGWSDGELGGFLGKRAEAYASAFAALPVSSTIKARESFAREWGKDDPEAASRWLADLSDDAAAKPVAEGLAWAWAEYDEYAASAWAASLPAGPKRDAAALGLVYRLARRLPDEAWDWGNSISDQEARGDAILTLDRVWAYEAPPKYRVQLDEARRAAGWKDRGERPPPDPNDPFR